MNKDEILCAMLVNVQELLNRVSALWDIEDAFESLQYAEASIEAYDVNDPSGDDLTMLIVGEHIEFLEAVEDRIFG